MIAHSENGEQHWQQRLRQLHLFGQREVLWPLERCSSLVCWWWPWCYAVSCLKGGEQTVHVQGGWGPEWCRRPFSCTCWCKCQWWSVGRDFLFQLTIAVLTECMICMSIKYYLNYTFSWKRYYTSLKTSQRTSTTSKPKYYFNVIKRTGHRFLSTEKSWAVRFNFRACHELFLLKFYLQIFGAESQDLKDVLQYCVL